jgi:hypothetical protein
MKKRIKINELAQYRHVQFTNGLNKQSGFIFSLLMVKLKKEIYQILKKNKLAKSDDPLDDKLEVGWTGEIPKIELNMEEAIGSTINKYMQALRWVMLGNYAGKDAKAMAEKLGLVGKVIPGILQSAYLNAIDAHREHHQDITGDEAPEMPRSLLKASFSKIMERSDRFLAQALDQMKNNIIHSLERTIDEKNFDNISKAHKDARDSVPSSDPASAVETASERLSNVLSLKAVGKSFDVANRKNLINWGRTVESEINLSAATATHQALAEIHGRGDDDVRVVWIAMEDEKTCDFCEKASKHPSGEFKFYYMSDFKPSGFNYGKKKSEWKLTIPGAHINCRCRLVYVPRGFRIGSNGTISRD